MERDGVDARQGATTGDVGRMAGRSLLEPWSGREEVEALPQLLRPAEGLVAVGTGLVVRSGRLAHSRWLVVLTDRRLLCLKGRDPETRKVIEMPVRAIDAVESKGLLRRSLVLETGYGKLRIDGLEKEVAAELVGGLTTLMDAYASGQEPLAAVEGKERDRGLRAATPSDQETGVGGDPGRGELNALEARQGDLEEAVEELTRRVAFLEELVRSNVSPE